MPKPARQIPPVLELFRLGAGLYSVRINDMKDNYIAVKLAELIPDLSTIQVITPVDMKIFKLDGEAIPEKVNGKSNSSVDLEINNYEDTPDPMDAAMELAEEAEAAPPSPQPKKAGRPKKSAAERQDICKRCGGSGNIQQIMEGGLTTEAPCHVCKGEGTITRFGVQR